MPFIQALLYLRTILCTRDRIDLNISKIITKIRVQILSFADKVYNKNMDSYVNLTFFLVNSVHDYSPVCPLVVFMKSFFRYLLIFFICLLSAGISAEAVCAAPVPGRFDALVKDLTKQLIFSRSEKGGEEKTGSLLRELRLADPAQGRIWEQILPYWDEVNKDGFVNAVRLPLASDQLPLPEALPDDDSLCIVILGYALDPDGTMKDELILRLKLGLDCARQYPDSYVLVTGGATASGKKDVTEADSMAGWLEENGIDSSRIIIENRSLTSVENALFSCELLRNDYPQIKSAVITTSDYHVPLGCLLFQAGSLLAEHDDQAEHFNVIANAGVWFEDSRSFPLSSQSHALWSLACSE